MKVIQELQGNRPVIVHAMGAIASTIPDGVYYTKIQKKGDTNISGIMMMVMIMSHGYPN